MRAGTKHLPLPELLQRQWYRLAHWRVGDEELNYRRFFDVESLAAVRVELPEVFAATHDVLVRLHRDGVLDGLRIDHPDGLADPRGYLRSLDASTGGAWVVVEKILEDAERLPDDWACAGTTGYDAMNRVLHVLTDADGDAPLRALWTSLTGDPADLEAVVDDSKRLVLRTSLRAEVRRLVDLAVEVCAQDIALHDFTRHRLTDALVELLVGFPRYRAYVVPGEPTPQESVEVVESAVARGVQRRPDLADELGLLAGLVLQRVGTGPASDELCVRFQQTCGPVMAKGVEDTAFYRWLPLTALCEVGGWPSPMGSVPESPPGADAVTGLHVWAARQQAEAAAGLTSLSTHDTKRSEDVRARLVVLSERPDSWADAVSSWRAVAAPHRSPLLDPATEYLLWQTLVGTTGPDGPPSAERLQGYLTKATREAKVRTTWTDPDPEYDRAVRDFLAGVLGDAGLRAAVAGFAESCAPAVRATTLGQKLLQLLLPGVPDVYQGCETVSLSLVDPDNRRPVDYAVLAGRLDRLDAGSAPAELEDEKLLVTSAALRVRRDHPDWFGVAASYEPVRATSPHAVAFARSDRVVAVVTRLADRLARSGGWGEAELRLPPGRWTDRLSGLPWTGRVSLAALLGDPAGLPVALLERTS